jgi:hypothetical protein
MARFRRRSTRGYLGRKRNVDRKIPCGNSTIVAGTQQVAYTFTAAVACVAKSIRLDVGGTSGGGVSIAVPYALVVVREGFNANNLNYPAVAGDLYNPTMDVLISGVLTDVTAEDHKSNSIGRKLKTGDRLALIFFNGSASDINVAIEMSFSVLT